MVEPVEDSNLVQALWDPWATPAWMFWGKDRKHLRFGTITPFPDLSEGFVQDVALSWISGVKWFEPIKPREIPEEDLRKEDEVEWMLMGPFPNPEDDSLTEDQYPPEREINPDAEYTLDDRTLKWMKVKPVDGIFDLRQVFETDRGIAYL